MMASSEFIETCTTDYKYVFDKDLLRGKVAFVTGGGSGIGFVITEILMRHGCDAVIASRRLERVEAAARTLEAATGRRCLALRMDVRKPQEVDAAVDAILARFGKIDILVNNAAGNFLSPAVGLSYNAFKTVMEIDAIGTFNTSRTVYSKWMKDHGGSIVNISATLYFRGTQMQAHAGAAKAAVDALTRHLAVEWGREGVRVNSVAPGPIKDTEGFRRLGGIVVTEEQIAQMIPIRRVGTREEIANCVVFLASQAGSLVSGALLVADGGAWLSDRSMEASESVMKQHLVLSEKEQGKGGRSRL